jgi:AcrR family transcriptional regulator
VASPVVAGLEDGSVVRRTIEEKALQVFAEKGYHAASIREIVEAAGVTAPTLYYHFGSKEGLFRHLVQQLTHQMTEEMEHVGRSLGSIREQLLALTHAYIHALRERPMEVRFMHRVMHGQIYQSHPQQLLENDQPDGGGALPRLMESAMARGELRSARPELLVNAFMGAMTMYIIRRVVVMACADGAPGHPRCTTGVTQADPADAEAIVDLFLAGAAAPKNP